MKDQLNEELKLWAAREEPSKDHLSNLSLRIHDEVVRERTLAAKRKNHSFKTGSLFILVGAAAALIMTFAYFTCVNVKPGYNGDAVAAAGISPEKLNATAKLVREMNSLFDGNWRWIAESEGDVNMGIKPLYGGLSVNAKPMLVRITLVAKKLGRTSWNQLWSSEVVMHSEETVEINTDQSCNKNLSLWVLPLDKGILHVDSSVSLSSPMRISSCESMVVKDGTPTELATFSEGKTCYKLYQTIKLLPADRKQGV